MPGSPSHLRFCLFPLLGTARGVEVATQLGDGELKAVTKWVWVGQLPGRFSSYFREEAGIVDEQWFQEASGRMAQGGDRLLTSSNLRLSVPNWLNVGIPLLARITASKDFGGHSPNCSTTYKKLGGSEGSEQGPMKLQIQMLARVQDQLPHSSSLA